MIDPVVIIAMLTVFGGLATIGMRYSFRSKCTSVNMLWGCCVVNRSPEEENVEEKMELEHNVRLSDLDVQNGNTK